MNRSLFQGLQTFPGFRPLAARVHPSWYFRVTRALVALARWISPTSIQRRRHFCRALRGKLDERQLRRKASQYLLNLRLAKDLEGAWRNWGHRAQDWTAIDGETHLRAALQQGRGAFLVSPHNFGFSKLVAPVLAQRGYKVHRGGNGGERGVKKRTRWGDAQLSWGYLDYKGDYWQRAKTLKAMQTVLAANEIVHVSPRSFRHGEEEMAGAIFGQKYFLDPTWFRIFDLCEAPVLPCFVIEGEQAPVNIVIHPALPPGKSKAAEFAAIVTRYIEKFPENGRMWKNITLERIRW